MISYEWRATVNQKEMFVLQKVRNVDIERKASNAKNSF